MRKILKDKELIRSIIIVLSLLAIFLLGQNITAPLINKEVVKQSMQMNSGSNIFLSMLNSVTGGSLVSFSFFAMGLSPYITTSIIMQMFEYNVIDKITELSKQGQQGRDKINRITRYLTIIVAFIQSFFVSMLLNINSGSEIVENYFSINLFNYAYVAFFLTVGVIFLMWIADQITKQGLGNGTSLVIATGIITNLKTVYDTVKATFSTFPENSGWSILYLVFSWVIYFIIILLIIFFTIHVNEAIKKIKIQYYNRRISSGAVKNFLPLKLNSAGVIPVIFSSVMVLAPSFIASFLPSGNIKSFINQYLAINSPTYILLYAILTIGFSYFYVLVQINPEQTADNLNKSGSYIPGIRPGKDTEKYIKKILIRLTFWGSIFLTTIVIVPMIISNFSNFTSLTNVIGGTSIMIIVSVAVDLRKRFENRINKQDYSKWMK